MTTVPPTHVDPKFSLIITPEPGSDGLPDNGIGLPPLSPTGHIPNYSIEPASPRIPHLPIAPVMRVLVEEVNNNRLGPAPTGEFTLWLTIDRNLRVPLTLTPQEQHDAAQADLAIRTALRNIVDPTGARGVDPHAIKWNYNFTLNHESLVFWVNGLEMPPLALDKPIPLLNPAFQVQIDAIKAALKTLENIHTAKKGGPLAKHSWKEGTLAVSSGGGSAFKVISHKKTFREGAQLARDHLTRLGANPDLHAIDATMGKYDVLRYRIKGQIDGVESRLITPYRAGIAVLRNNPNRTLVQEANLQQYQLELQAKEDERDQLNAFLKSVEGSDGYAITMALHYKEQLEGLGGLNPQNLATLVTQISRDLRTTRQDIQDNRGMIERIKSVFSSAVDTSKDREYATVIAGLVLTLCMDALVPEGVEPGQVASEIAKRKAQFLMTDLFHGLTPPSGIDFHLVSVLGGQTTHTQTQISSALHVSPACAARVAHDAVQGYIGDLAAAQQAQAAERRNYFFF